MIRPTIVQHHYSQSSVTQPQEPRRANWNARPEPENEPKMGPAPKENRIQNGRKRERQRERESAEKWPQPRKMRKTSRADRGVFVPVSGQPGPTSGLFRNHVRGVPMMMMTINYTISHCHHRQLISRWGPTLEGAIGTGLDGHSC